MRPAQLRRALAFAAGAGLFAWFVFLIRGGLASWFDADDLMNMHFYWIRPWSALLKANLAFWSSFYRPGGGLFYKSIYALWGFHPLPFRTAVLALLSVNFGLLALVVWQLTRSRWGTLIALLVVGINPSFSAAYFDTGTIYDVLAYTFFWGAFAFYVYVRQGGRLPGWGGLALIFCLFIAALDAKEVSVSLPAAVGLYELVWHPPKSSKLEELWRWIRQEGRFAVITGLAGVVYIIGKKYGPDSLWQMGAYQPHFSAKSYLQSLSHYLSQLVYEPGMASKWFRWLPAAMLALAVTARRRCLLWAVGFIAVSLLPLAFIPGRGGFAYLVPSAGCAVYASGFVDWLLELLTGRRTRLRMAAQVLVLAALVVIVAPWQRKWIEIHAGAAHEMQQRYRRYIEQIRALIPAPRKGATILLLSDAEGRDDYDVYFVMRLYYGDPALEVHRMVVWKQHNVHVDPAGYDYVLDWVDKRFVLVSHR
ncbi:MAG TPA: hypothetical protein VMG35_03870 [Bryobacteraceae bacterium]|nr:hypothetical protein [Bryobacteraceae bacterium]